MSTMFDTLQYTKGAELVGMPRAHAEYQAQQLGKLANEGLATKKDLEEMRVKIIDQLSIRVGYMMVGVVTIIVALLGFVIKN